MAKATTMTRGKMTEIPNKAELAYGKNIIADVYLKTVTGVTMLIGRDSNEVREQIEQANSPLDYRFFDDDKRKWAYWAVKDVDGKIKPLTFPSISEYSLTSPQLYAKAVTYLHILAHAVGLLKEKPTTLWDKMMKPTTIILAIIAIVFIMGIMLVALQG